MSGIWRRNTSVRALFLFALAVRLAFVFLLHFYPAPALYPQEDPEAIHFARGILNGTGWTNPYLPEHGIPSAWRSPLHSLVLAGLMGVTGDDGFRFRIAVHIFYSIVSAATVVGVCLLASRCLNRDVGYVAGVFAAAYPADIYYATYATSDATLVCAALVWLAFAMICFAEANTRRAAGAAGLVAGSAALVNPATLSVLAGLLIWPFVVERNGQWLRRLSNTVFVLAVGTAVVFPWLVRNRLAFGEWVFLRTNFGMEFRGANRGDGISFMSRELFYMSDPLELAKLRSVGEPAYDRDCLRRGIDWVREDPLRFFRSCIQRFGVFWGKEVLYGEYLWISIPFVAGPLLLVAWGPLAFECHMTISFG